MAGEQETRDIAVKAATLIEAHMLDCTHYREAQKEAQGEFRDDLKKINYRMAMLLGGLIVLSHGVDWLLSMTGHK